MLSKKLELVQYKLLENKEKAETNDKSKPNNNFWEESSAYGNLIMDFKLYVGNDLLNLNNQNKLPINEYNIVSCNILQNIRCNVEVYNGSTRLGSKLSDFEKNSLKQIDYVSSVTKNIISDYCDLILDDNYALGTNITINMTKLYFRKIFILLFFRWKNNLVESFQMVNEFNKLLEKINYQINPQMNFSDNYNQLNSRIENTFMNLNEKNNYYKQLIIFVEKYIKEYEKLDKYCKSCDNISDDSRNQKQHNVIKNNSEIPINVNVNVVNNNEIKNYKVKTKQMKNNDDTKNKESKKRLVKTDLDLLKVSGLRKKCEELNLNTNKCSLRKDYIELLLPYCEK